ncbi:MAG: hypothetical protein ACKO6N_00455 [Myxococcota bacterium]
MSAGQQRCSACGSLFVPNRFHPQQQFCSHAECRRARKQAYKKVYNRQWREANPDYFRQYWLEYRTLG